MKKKRSMNTYTKREQTEAIQEVWKTLEKLSESLNNLVYIISNLED